MMRDHFWLHTAHMLIRCLHWYSSAPASMTSHVYACAYLERVIPAQVLNGLFQHKMRNVETMSAMRHGNDSMLVTAW